MVEPDTDARPAPAAVVPMPMPPAPEVACASDPGQMSEAVVTKWSLVRKQ